MQYNSWSVKKAMKEILFTLFVCLAITGCGGSGGNTPCTTLDCETLKYNLFLVDLDFSQASPQAINIQVIESNSFQDMTHPRISPDKLWVAYTTYNDTNSEGCASHDSGFVNTEIRTTSVDGVQSTSIISATNGELTSNNYWYDNNYEFTYLSGAPGLTKIYRGQTDTLMNLVTSPTEITIPNTITPFDPHAISNNQLVYGGLYDSGGLVKSIFMQSLNPPGPPIGLSLGRDSAGTTLYGSDVLENDPKISPDGNSVAFMRFAPNAGGNGFGWRIFVVLVANPLSEVNISASLGATLLNNDTLPEWVDNTTLVFSNIDITTTSNTRTIWMMKSDGSDRKQVILPEGYRYSDVYPFVDGSGNQKIIISAEKIGAICAP